MEITQYLYICESKTFELTDVEEFVSLSHQWLHTLKRPDKGQIGENRIVCRLTSALKS